MDDHIFLWYAASYGAGLMYYFLGNRSLKVTPFGLTIGPAITIWLLYMGGAFSQ